MYIVTAADLALGFGLDAFMQQGAIKGLVSHCEDPNESADYRRAQRRVDTWIVDSDADLEQMVDYMSNNFVGMDICVFELKSVSVRSPGNLKTKSVTKDGILPA